MRRALLALLFGAVLSVGIFATSTTAQGVESETAAQAEDIDINDFIDPVTGEIDLEAYFAALAADQNADQDGSILARTGFDASTLVGLGVVLAVVGGAVIVSRRREVSV